MAGSCRAGAGRWDDVSRKLQVLIVEDSEDDALLAVQELRRAGFDPSFQRVETGERLREALGAGAWDLVVADYSLPQFSGLAALKMVRELRGDLPVIIVSGAIGEDVAVDAMRAGANDYVMKDKLPRLGPAVERELREAEDRRRRKLAEEELRRTTAELDDALRDLVQSEKLAALGRFSSGIAHEVKNPLGIILGGIELLEVKLKRAGADARTALQKMKDAAVRAADIVDQVLRFAKPSELQLAFVDPVEMVAEALSLFQYSEKARGVTIETAYATERLRIEIDKHQIQQVLFNLLSNAVDAMGERGVVRVEVSRVEAAGQRLCRISVIDQGQGIAAADMGRIFEPFFTTKRDRKGTGLGLSMAKSTVEHHRGVLKLESEEGKGTRASVLLPLAAGD